MTTPDPRGLPGLSGLRGWELLSNGPSSQVWSAIDGEPERKVAIKLVPIADAVDAERFQHECAAHLSLSTKNGVITLYDFRLVDEQRVGWLKLEYCSGGSLQDRLDRFGPLDPMTARRHLAGVADALVAAHARQQLHCDVKPANILIDEHGDAKLADFGIARTFAHFDDAADVDTTDRVTGFTPGYVPPEVPAQGGSPSYRPPEAGLAIESERTTRYDVWLLAATFVALVIGGPPTRGESAQTTRARLRMVGVDEVLARMITEALASDPRQRPSMSEFREALTPPKAPTPSVRMQPRGRHRAIAMLVAATLLGGGSAALAVWARSGDRSDAADTNSPAAPTTKAVPATTVAPVRSTVPESTSSPSLQTGALVADLRILDGGPSAGQDPAAASDQEGSLVVYSRFDRLTTHLGTCNDECSDFTSTTLDSLGVTAHYPRIAIADGVPTIVAADSRGGGVVVISCADRSCARTERREIPISAEGRSATQQLSPRPSPDEQLIALHVDVAIGPANRPVVVFDDPGSKAVTLLLCDDPTCSTWRTRPVGIGVWPKVAVSDDGIPMVVFSSGSLAGPLTLFRCTDVDCLTAQQRSFDRIGMRPAISVAGSNVVIAGLDFTQPAITVVTCSDLACQNATTSAIDVDTSYPTVATTATGSHAYLAYFAEADAHGVIQVCEWPCETWTKGDITSTHVSFSDDPSPFTVESFGHDPAPVIGPTGRLTVFGFMIPATDPTRALGVVVSRSGGCRRTAFCSSPG